MKLVCEHGIVHLKFDGVTFCREIGWITLKYKNIFATQKIDTHVRELDLGGEKNKQEKLGLIAHKHDA